MMGWRRAFFRHPGTSLLTASLVWLTVLLKQHDVVQKISRDRDPNPRLHAKLPRAEEPSAKVPLEMEENHIKKGRKNISLNTNTINNETSSHFIERTPPSDGRFNNLPVVLRAGAPSSAVRCIDHNDDERSSNISWMFRSCQFTNLCFDMNQSKYVLVRDSNSMQQMPDVALGGINPRWDVGHGFDRGSWKVRWFPEILDASTTTTSVSHYYQLPDSVVLVPFHSFAGHNVGHLLWDDFYPIFRLLQLFDLIDHRPLLIRQALDEKLYATCDIRRNKRIKCMNNFVKFLPLLGVDPNTFSVHKKVQFQSLKSPKSSLVCANTAVAGLGMMTDHGLRDHGWENRKADEEWIPHNLGKGRTFFDFRSFMLENISRHNAALRVKKKKRGSSPRISFSLLSSRDWDRRLDFAKQMSALRDNLPADNSVRIQSFTLWNMTLEQQIAAALESDIFVSTCGGASMTSTFLPRGASLILFYNTTGGLDFASFKSSSQPARLDWDLLNSASHLRVHWLPITTMNSKDDLELFVQLVEHELTVIQSL